MPKKSLPLYFVADGAHFRLLSLPLPPQDTTATMYKIRIQLAINYKHNELLSDFKGSDALPLWVK